MTELLTQDKANSFDELDALEQIGEVEKLDVAEIFVADHVAFPQEVQLIARPNDVDDKVKTRNDLDDVVNGKKRFQLPRLAMFHQPKNAIVMIIVDSVSLPQLTPGPTEAATNKPTQPTPLATPMTSSATYVDQILHRSVD